MTEKTVTYSAVDKYAGEPLEWIRIEDPDVKLTWTDVYQFKIDANLEDIEICRLCFSLFNLWNKQEFEKYQVKQIHPGRTRSMSVNDIVRIEFINPETNQKQAKSFICEAVGWSDNIPV